DVKRKVAGTRAIRSPARAQLIAGIGNDGADHQQDGRDRSLHHVSGDAGANAIFRLIPLFHREDPQGRVEREAGAAGAAPGATPYLERNPAAFIDPRCVSSAFVSQSTYSLPLMVVWLNAPFSMYSFHSGVSRTFFSRST